LLDSLLQERMISGPPALPRSILSPILSTACFAYLISLLFASTVVLAQDSEPPPPPPPPVDLYCGEMNCYDLLGVTRDSNTKEISKAYRKAAGKWHPDKHQGVEEKKRAERIFMHVAAGYEVLRDNESRKEYDYMLDHPEEMFGNYYRYYARRLAPRVDIRIVLVALVTIVSALQYYIAWFNFEAAISHLATVPKYRLQALEVARERRPDLGGKTRAGKEREAAKAREEAAVREVIAELMDRHGGYQRPEVADVLWVQVVRFPKRVCEWLLFNVIWIWRFTILRQPLGLQEQHYLVRRNLGLSERQWEAMEEGEREVYMQRRLWEPEAWARWREEREEEERQRNAMSGRSKQERRWLKHGDNRMTFDENYDW